MVPCYDEAARLRVADFESFVDRVPAVDFLFVDDGSRDATGRTLDELAARGPERFAVLHLESNRGKAEAVRRGLRAAFERAPRYAGYWDADLATPLAEIPRFVQTLDERSEVELLYGARVRLLGRRIERRALRHYAGRIFATCASQTLRLPIYDTQCGAKLFRVSPETAALFETPFCSSWVFDVEILARLIAARRDAGGPAVEESVYELPLRSWRHVPGSKVGALDFVRALRDLLRIRHRYLRRP